jgi:hypothetical protein
MIRASRMGSSWKSLGVESTFVVLRENDATERQITLCELDKMSEEEGRRERERSLRP